MKFPKDLIKQYLDIVETLYFRGIELDKSIKIGKVYVKAMMKEGDKI